MNISFLNFHLCTMRRVPATIPCVRLLSVSLFFFLSPQFEPANPRSQKRAKKKTKDRDFKILFCG